MRVFCSVLMMFGLVTATACGPIIDPDTAWAELGAGPGDFLPVEEGAVFEVERGSQGGMHIWVGLRAYGIDPGPTEMWQGLVDGTLPIIRFDLESPDGILTEDLERPYVLERLGGSEYQLLDNLVQFDHFPELPDNWAELDWQEVEAAMEQLEIRLSVQITDAQGTVVVDERLIRLDFPDALSPPEGVG